MDKGNLLPAFMRSSANFNVYPQFFQIEDHAALLKDFRLQRNY